jgi:hypothetical protein
VTDHGVDNCQYFQGHGISLTDYEDCATGCGDSFNEAFEDALDSLAQNDWDVSSIVNEDSEHKDANKSVAEFLDLDCENDEDMEDCESYYYVSIDVK